MFYLEYLEKNHIMWIVYIDKLQEIHVSSLIGLSLFDFFLKKPSMAIHSLVLCQLFHQVLTTSRHNECADNYLRQYHNEIDFRVT